MNTNLGLIGKKLGNTQIFNDDGSVTPVTVVETGPCVVVGKRTMEKDGYSALQLGFGTKDKRHVNKAQKVAFEKAGVAAPEVIREFRLSPEVVGKYEVGQQVKASDVFTAGQIIDITGLTKGRGYTGVMKRWNFAGSKASHGAHEYQRHGGSIGTNMTPGRTLPNVKMAGQYGSERVTMQKIRVARVVDADNLVLVAGSVPGSKNSIVELRGTVKLKTAASSN
jgi:large subunit ribosomal protein L3